MSSKSEKTKKHPKSNLLEARVNKMRDLHEMGINPFSSGFVPDHTSAEFRSKYEENVDSEGSEAVVSLAGRIMALRLMGKAAFVKLRDSAGDFQAYFSKDALGPDNYKLLKKLDVGDIIGVRGRPFKTRSGELSVLTEDFSILTKSLRPLPEKWHGLSDVEIRYRQRYLDLIANPEVREIVKKRIQIVHYLRTFLVDRGFMEVETPMMQPLPGGATAKPFQTYHNALERHLYLRIAPELYLKRLLVGGFERVFEINRNFRNEGVSTQHNPEFTMIEFYQAYATYEDFINLTEEMISSLAKDLTGDFTVMYDGRQVDLTPPWERLSVRQSLVKYLGLSPEEVEDRGALISKALETGIEVGGQDPPGKLCMALFEELVEPQLWGPVFIYGYPVEVSPLARRNEADPSVTDRFELYISGREMANAFTELTDPVDQRNRFEEQVRARDAGDEEAHFLDEDFLRALEYGMPPAAGEGMGIDRLVMLLTDAKSIREVILFPHMKPEKGLG